MVGVHCDTCQPTPKEGFERFATMQNHSRLAYREAEREMLPLCGKEGVGVIPWGRWARGISPGHTSSWSRRPNAAAGLR